MTKGFFYAFITLLYVIGFIGGVGCAFYNGEYFIAFMVIVLAIMAFPTAKKYYDKWTSL